MKEIVPFIGEVPSRACPVYYGCPCQCMALTPSILQDAATAGCATVSGLEMFVGQAAEQFRLFTDLEPPVELMRQVVVDSLQI